MNWGQIADISTTFGVGISTLTLVSGFRLYRMSKQHEYIKQIRNILISFKFNSDSLNQTLSYEIVNEIVSTVIYSNSIKNDLSKIYSEFFDESEKSQTELQEYLKKLKPITVPIHSQIVEDFKANLKLNSELSSQVFTDYPAMYRVFESTIYLFNDIIDISKHMVRDEEMFADFVNEAFEEKEEIKSLEDLQDHIFHLYMPVIIQKQGRNDHKDAEDMLNILGLTVNAYMRLTDSQLYKQRRKESNTKFKAFDKTEDMFEDLLEAEKGLKIIMGDSEILIFRELSTRIKVRNERE